MGRSPDPQFPTLIQPAFPRQESSSANQDTDEDDQFALLVQQQGAPHTTTVTAIADSGASHILLRKADDHVLNAIEYSLPHAPPFATLKAANGTQLNAIGRGFLRLTPDIELQAYIFADAHLTANLLGLAPLCDRDCTATFTPNAFQITQHQGQPPILTGHRLTKDRLWRVTLSDAAKTEHAKTSTSGKGNGGTYIAANSVRDTDAESYVKFIHASLGFPAPTTFLKAVTRGYITGPNQFPRLTPKMVRRYMPNAIATARGHLDKTTAAQPHDLSEAVSARKRHHLRELTARRKASDKDQGKHAPFSHAAVPKSTTLHLDYTGPLPEPCASGTRYFMVSCWGCYIHLEPLTTLRAAQTTAALT